MSQKDAANPERGWKREKDRESPDWVIKRERKIMKAIEKENEKEILSVKIEAKEIREKIEEEGKGKNK